MKLGECTDEARTVEFEGVVIGFCCDDCFDAWKVMDDAERRDRVGAALAKKT